MELLLLSRGGAGDPVESLWCIKSRACVKLALWDPNDSTLSASQSPIPERNLQKNHFYSKKYWQDNIFQLNNKSNLWNSVDEKLFLNQT